jgi:hypothetical protein
MLCEGKLVPAAHLLAMQAGLFEIAGARSLQMVFVGAGDRSAPVEEPATGATA